MSFRTLKAIEECLAELVSCGQLYINEKLYDLTPILNALKNQTTTLFDETIMAGPVTANDVVITSPTGIMDSRYLSCVDIYPTTGGTLITINSPFLYSYVPNANSKNSLKCENLYLEKTTLPILSTLASIFREINLNSSSFMIAVGKYATYDSTILNMYYVQSANSSNYAQLMFGGSSTGIFFYNSSVQLNKILYLRSEDTSTLMPIPYNYLNKFKLTSDASSTGNLNYSADFRGTVNEINMNFSTIIFKIGGALYLKAGDTTTTYDDIEYYSGVIWNSTFPDNENNTGTPLYLFEDPQGTSVAAAAYPWTIRSGRGPLIFISKDGDIINNTPRSLTSGTLNMFRMGIDENDKEWWCLRFIGHCNSYTMGASRPPLIYSVGVMRSKAAKRLRNFRFHLDQDFQSSTVNTNMLAETNSYWTFRCS